MKRQPLVEYAWQEFSSRFASPSRQGLPLGTKLVLEDVNGRRKRCDWRVKVKTRRLRHMAQASETEKVSDLLDRATDCLSTDIRARGLKCRLYCPQGNRIHGNTLVGTVRAMPSQLTEDDHQAAEQRNWDVDEVQRCAYRFLYHEAERGIEDPADVVVHAVVFALIDRYSRAAVLEALSNEECKDLR